MYIESAKTVNEMTLNELVKLTTLWTTGPRFLNWKILKTYTFMYMPVYLDYILCGDMAVHTTQLVNVTVT